MSNNADTCYELLGALVGLAKSTENNPPKDTTLPIIIEAIELLAKDMSANSEDLEGRAARQKDMTYRVREEKYLIVPNCRYCANPCGNTSDCPADKLAAAFERRTVRELWRGIVGLAENASSMPDKGDALAFSSIYKCLAVLDFDWTDEEIEELLREIG